MDSSRLRARPVRVAVVIVAIVLISIAGAYVIQSGSTGPPKLSSTSTVATSESAPAVPLRTTVDEFFRDFNSRNISGLIQLYYSGANVIWSGNAPGLTGGYSGSYAIQILYGTTLGKMTQLTAKTTNYAEKATSPSNANVTLTLLLNGTSTTVGRLNGTIEVTQQWAFSEGHWEVVNENWNYKSFDVEFPTSATTFPQWGAMRHGLSPSLVSEKSVEWNFAPFVAAGVYGFLAAIALAYVRRRQWANRRKI